MEHGQQASENLMNQKVQNEYNSPNKQNFTIRTDLNEGDYYLIIKGKSRKFQLTNKSTLSKQHQTPVFIFKNYNEFDQLVFDQITSPVSEHLDDTNLTEPNNELYSKPFTDSEIENNLLEKNLKQGFLYVIINKFCGSFVEIKINEEDHEVYIMDDEGVRGLEGVQSVFALNEYKMTNDIFEKNNNLLSPDFVDIPETLSITDSPQSNLNIKNEQLKELVSFENENMIDGLDLNLNTGKLPKELASSVNNFKEKIQNTIEKKNQKLAKVISLLDKKLSEIKDLKEKNAEFHYLNEKYDKVLEELYQRDKEVTGYLEAIEERDNKIKYYEENNEKADKSDVRTRAKEFEELMNIISQKDRDMHFLIEEQDLKDSEIKFQQNHFSDLAKGHGIFEKNVGDNFEQVLTDNEIDNIFKNAKMQRYVESDKTNPKENSKTKVPKRHKKDQNLEMEIIEEVTSEDHTATVTLNNDYPEDSDINKESVINLQSFNDPSLSKNSLDAVNVDLEYEVLIEDCKSDDSKENKKLILSDENFKKEQTTKSNENKAKRKHSDPVFSNEKSNKSLDHGHLDSKTKQFNTQMVSGSKVENILKDITISKPEFERSFTIISDNKILEQTKHLIENKTSYDRNEYKELIENTRKNIITLFRQNNSELKDSDVIFNNEKKVQYYYFPVYSSCDTHLMGFTVKNKAYGFCKLFDNKLDENVEYLSAWFYKGKIHCFDNENLQLYHHSTKNLKFSGRILNGLRQDLCKTYYPNGQLEFNGNFENDEIHGNSVEMYHENGCQKEKGNFSHGLREGHHIEFYPSQFVKSEGNWSLGKKESKPFKEYNVDGDLIYIGGYRNNLKHGYGVEYHEKSIIKYEGQFFNGNYYGDSCKITNKDGTAQFVGQIDQDGTKVLGHGILYHDDGSFYYEGDMKNNGPHGKGIKLYNTRGLIYYQGGMAYGVKQGNGCLYWNYSENKKKYEGKFVNDGPHGKNCKIYNAEGKLEFEGEMMEGKKENKGTQYHPNEKIWYKGEFKNNQRNGSNAVVYYPNGQLMYEGPLNAGNKEGFGKLFDFHKNTQRYEGQFENDKFHGAQGTLYNLETNNKEYVGSFINGKRQGFGKAYYPDGKIAAEDSFANDLPEGHSVKLYHQDGYLEYEGTVVGGVKQGFGKQFFDNGKTSIEGNFDKGKPHGNDIKVFCNNGEILYVGNILYGKRNGKGKQYWPLSGKLAYIGEFNNGVKQSDQCISFNSDGIKEFEGRCENNHKMYGTLYDTQGAVIYKGPFEDDKPSKQGILGKEYYDENLDEESSGKPSQEVYVRKNVYNKEPKRHESAEKLNLKDTRLEGSPSQDVYVRKSGYPSIRHESAEKVDLKDTRQESSKTPKKTQEKLLMQRSSGHKRHLTPNVEDLVDKRQSKKGIPQVNKFDLKTNEKSNKKDSKIIEKSDKKDPKTSEKSSNKGTTPSGSQKGTSNKKKDASSYKRSTNTDITRHLKDEKIDLHKKYKPNIVRK